MGWIRSGIVQINGKMGGFGVKAGSDGGNL